MENEYQVSLWINGQQIRSKAMNERTAEQVKDQLGALLAEHWALEIYPGEEDGIGIASEWGDEISVIVESAGQ